MKTSKTVFALFALVGLTTGIASATEYFFVGSNQTRWGNGTNWANVDDPSAAKVSHDNLEAGSVCWLLQNATIGSLTSTASSFAQTTTGKTICLGSPAGVPVPDVTTEQSHTMMLPADGRSSVALTLKWYCGTISYVWWYKLVATISGTLSVEPGTTHRIITDKSANKLITLSTAISSASEDVSIDLSNSRTDLSPAILDLAYGYYPFTGDNSGYKGSFKVLTAFSGYEIGGTQTLGDPETPKAAALVLNNNCFVNIASAQTAEKQCATRGIQLAGDTGYINVKSGTPTLLYAISKADCAVGTCIKSGAGTLTFQGAYTAGDLVVSNGTLVLGADATFPAGQRFVVKDGATLQITAGTGLTTHTIEKEGSGQVVYPEGWRLTSAGVWEAKVTVSAVGGGSVSATEIWTAPGVTQTVTATPDAGNFVIWSGDTTAIQNEGHDVFANAISIKVSGPSVLTATFADLAAAKPTDFSDTGVTGTFANRTLTINVDEGATCTYDYASMLTSGWVTNIVKTGAGAITPAVASTYRGSFDFQAGTVTVDAAGELGADNVGVIRKASGVTMTLGTAVATGKKMYLAGTVSQTENASAVSGCDVVLTGALIWRMGGSKAQPYFFSGCQVDVNGHDLSFNSSQTYAYYHLSNVTFTNGNEKTASTISTPNQKSVCFEGTVAFWGGVRNTFKMANGGDTHFSLYGKILGDWTIKPGGRSVQTTDGNAANTLAYRIDGTFSPNPYNQSLSRINSNMDFSKYDNCLTFGGPVTGSNPMEVKGGTLNYLSSGSDYSGTLTITDVASKNLRSCIYVWNGANFSAGETRLGNADFWMDDDTAFVIPALKQIDGTKAVGTCTVSGGTTDTTIAGFTKEGGETLTFDTPAHVTGTTLIQTNTLALGSGTTANELPVFDHLSFANGTTFDMNGKDLTIGNLTGIPTVTNPGTLTITGNWTVGGDALVDGGKLNLGAGALAFGSGATITITKGTKSVPHEVAVAVAQGGITGSPTAGAGGVRRDFKIAQSGTELRAAAFGLMLYVR